MIDIDWTLGALLINFLVLVFLLNVVLFRPIRKVLKERQARLDAQTADINLMETQGQGLDSEIKDKLTAARREGAGARESLKEEGVAAETSLLAEVKREADLEWSRVEQKIKGDMARAREALKAQAQSFAQLLASKILGRELS
jgi:F-type H+-transporting ATPase subunit b